MFCINCFHRKTVVANSRPHIKTAQIWRRRACAKCNHLFTTYERPALHEEIEVKNTNDKIQMFNTGRLFVDILDCLQVNSEKRYDDAFWLQQTVEEAVILLGSRKISTTQLKEIAYSTLVSFDQIAGIQYAAKYGMSNKLRRGRPKKT